MKRRQRWRAVGVEWRGYIVARIKESGSGRIVGVYFRLGKWRRYDGTDAPVRDKALAACARRAIQKADPQTLNREFHARVGTAMNGEQR